MLKKIWNALTRYLLVGQGATAPKEIKDGEQEANRKAKRKAEIDNFFNSKSALSRGNRWKKAGNDTAHAYSHTRGGGKGLHH